MWTTELPTEPGYYWHYGSIYGSRDGLSLFSVWDDHGKMQFKHDIHGWILAHKLTGQWMRVIPPR